MTFAVSISTTTTQIDVPISAPAPSFYQARILDAQGNELQKAQGDAPSASFSGVAANGSYIAELSRLDVNGAVIVGSVISASFATPADAVTTVKIDVPAGPMTVSVTQE